MNAAKNNIPINRLPKKNHDETIHCAAGIDSARDKTV
jgi:hypothetical protein